MAHEAQWARVLDAATETASSLDDEERVTLLALALQLGPTITESSVGCSITQATETGYVTPAACNNLALELDLAQYVHAKGPCVAACRTGETYDIVLMADEPAFPLFTAAATRLGVRSSLSLPLPNRRSTALNLYAAAPNAFSSSHAKASASLLGRCAGQFLPDSVAERVADQEDLHRALRSRETVIRAQQLLAERHQLDLATAFETMIVRSSRQVVSMLDVACAIVEESADDL